MLCEIAIFATHDLEPMTEFPHEHSDWVDGAVIQNYSKVSDLSRHRFPGVEQTRTVTT